MSNRDGFKFADLDTAYFDDPKVRALARRLIGEGRPELIAPALLLHVALICYSMGNGERVAIEDVLPLWWPGTYGEHAAALEAVGLIDAERRIPRHAWERHAGEATERKGRRRWEGAIGGLMARNKISREEAIAELERREAAQALKAGSKSPSSTPSSALEGALYSDQPNPSVPDPAGPRPDTPGPAGSVAREPGPQAAAGDPGGPRPPATAAGANGHEQRESMTARWLRRLEDPATGAEERAQIEHALRERYPGPDPVGRARRAEAERAGGKPEPRPRRAPRPAAKPDQPGEYDGLGTES